MLLEELNASNSALEERAFALTLQVEDAPEENTMDTGSNTKWSWSGKMIDCNGRTCRFYLGEKGPNDTPFLVELIERDGHASRLEGHAEIISEGEFVKIRSAIKGGEKDSPITWEGTLKTSDAGPYAKKSMFGTYESAGAGAPTVLGRGVVVLWQFA